MSSRQPMLIAEQGREGLFRNWLEEIGLKDFISRFSLPQLVEWGWLVPQYRMVFPDEFFNQWKTFPYGFDGPIPDDHDPYYLLWDSYWFADNDQEPFWFLHPFFRPDDKAGSLLRKSGLAGLKTQPPKPISHPGGQTVFPYADYFFHWQGYALIDVIRSADCIAPLFVTPDIDKHVAGMVRSAERVKEAHDPRDVLTIPRRWGGLSTPLTWLSHYRAFREAIGAYEIQHDHDRAIRREGARQLAKHLGITTDALSRAIKDKLLVLAQDWRRANAGFNIWTMRAWPSLQKDLSVAMEWLCYLSERPLDYYLDKWQYGHMGQAQWAELHKVLPYEYFEYRQCFLKDAPRYLKDYNEFLPAPDRLEGENLRNITDHLSSANYPFGGFLAAFCQMHDELTFSASDIGKMDFRERRPIDHYSLLAIRVEGALRFALKESDSLPKKESLSEYIVQLARQNEMSEAAILVFRENRRLTNLHEEPEDPIGAIKSLTTPLSAREHYQVRAFLCCVLARNYFAHHYYLYSKVIHSENAGFMYSGILVTLVTLLRPQLTRS